MKPKLSPAQRTMLHNAVNGRPLLLGLTGNSLNHRTHSTVQALHRAGMLQALHRAGMLQGADHKPTEAGIAYFKTPA